MPPDLSLRAVVTAFDDDVTAALEDATAGLPTVERSHLATDVVMEAFNLVTAMIDADGRHTDDELWELAATFGPLLPDLQIAGAKPSDLRGSTLVAGRCAWLETPSALFEVLVAADSRSDTTHAMTYFHRAMDLVHTVGALGDLITDDELAAIAAFRGTLLSRIRSVGPHEGVPQPSTVAPDSALGKASATTPPPPDDPPEPLEDLLAELDALVGLAAVKRQVRQLCDLLRVNQIRVQHDLPTVSVSLHQVFVGNPGTGKTTVARLLAKILRTLGVSKRGHLVETDRSGLVAGFVGQTAPLVTRKFDEADGGTLFIDEAYTLARGNEGDFGREAIDALVKLMEDRRDRVTVIVAGYPDEMANFIAANPGLTSRFPTTIRFPDYSTDDLLAIFDQISSAKRYALDDDARRELHDVLEATPRDKGFGNGRLARNLFEAAISCQATRLVASGDGASPTEAELTTLTVSDLRAAATAGEPAA